MSSPRTWRSVLPLLVALLVALCSLVYRDRAVVDAKGDFVPLLIADDAYM